MGGAHFAQGQPEVALPENERSLALREKTRDEVGVMWTLVHIGVLHGSQRRFEDAGKVYERALAIAESKPDQNAASTILALRSQLEFEQEKLDAAQASARALWRSQHRSSTSTPWPTRAWWRGGHTRRPGARPRRAGIRGCCGGVRQVRRVRRPRRSSTIGGRRTSPSSTSWPARAASRRRSCGPERGRQRVLADMLGGDGAVVVKDLTADERNPERAVAKDLRRPP